MTANHAIFMDRDGTLVLPRHYPRRPQDLVIYDGVPEALQLLQQRGWLLVVVTNQSGIARGLITEEELKRMHSDLRGRLAACGVTVHAFYHCPHHPDGVIDELSINCECRKPGSVMLTRAAADLDVDLAGSWLVGDILDDIEAGNRVGCRTILVDQGTEGQPGARLRRPSYVARETVHALRIIHFLTAAGAPAELDYVPQGWDFVPDKAAQLVPPSDEYVRDMDLPAALTSGCSR